ncbi:flagellar hook-length control protein FliK [Legionella micdadei]|uniref:flagellar hook-length control protein FliK n=1 Tax=Legionella micdadei TaxID=451 RepID=UPI0009EF7500|nr:flagellar hook-length control protein FliK [Legionella micdadei]ARH00326.1 hypothetical protein B6V88_07775 [Legionella micdadei]
MMDIIQLLLPQPIASEEMSVEERREYGEEGGAVFLAIMDSICADEVMLSGEPRPDVIQENLAIATPLQGQEEVCLIPDIKQNDGEIDVEKNTNLPSDEANDQTSVQNLPQLAWFDCESFQPPLKQENIKLIHTDEKIFDSASLILIEHEGIFLSEKIEENTTEIEENTTKINESDGQQTEKFNPPLIPWSIQLPQKMMSDVIWLDHVGDLFVGVTTELNKYFNAEKQTNSTTGQGGLTKNLNPDIFERIKAAEPQTIPTDDINFIAIMSQPLLTRSDENNDEFPEPGELNLKNDHAPMEVSPTSNNTATIHIVQKTPTTDHSTRMPNTMELTQNLADPDWGDHFNQQILWLGQQKIKAAIIKINPQELGPLEVSVNVKKDDATVNITLLRAQIHEVIENAIPRLREMMAEQGLNLIQVNIESNQQRQNSQQWHNTLLENIDTNEVEASEEPIKIIESRNLVDYFA